MEDAQKEVQSVDTTATRFALKNTVRLTLTDITNAGNSDRGGATIVVDPDEYIRQLVEENAALVKLIEKKNKFIEFKNGEMVNLRKTLHKLQMQNCVFARTNNRLLMELNCGKEKLKALQHEVSCKEALLKAKEMEVKEVKLRTTCLREEGRIMKPCDKKEMALGRSKSTGTSTVRPDVEVEDARNKRRCMSRQTVTPSEDLFEIVDAAFPLRKSDNAEGKCEVMSPGNDEKSDVRSSVGRPLRRAAEKVESYKEISLRTKMRRP